MSDEVKEYKPNIREAMKLADSMAEELNIDFPGKDDEIRHTVILAMQICQMGSLLDLGMAAEDVAALHKDTMRMLHSPLKSKRAN